jgi:hypothetical protein
MYEQKNNCIVSQPSYFPTLECITPPYSLFTKFVFLGLLFFIFNCGLDVEDPTPPSPPAWVQKSLPEEWPERGIDAYENNSIYLEWETNSEEDIEAYWIYRAKGDRYTDSIGKYISLARLDDNHNPTQWFIDQSSKQGNIYHYKLRAENQAGSLGEYSSSISYSLLPVILVETMTPNGLAEILGEDRALRWRYRNFNEMENYTITVLSEENSLVLRSNEMPGNYVGGNESWHIPVDIILISGMIYKWRIDTGGHFVDGYETAGSESYWAYFKYLNLE